MKTCLVIDDSSAIRKVARRIIEGMEFEIMEAEDGADALDKCRARLPDIVLVDSNMPNMDGIEFIKMLRQMPGGDRPKIVLCTMDSNVGYLARALHAGADEYILKPFCKETLEAKFQGAGLVQAEPRRARHC